MIFRQLSVIERVASLKTKSAANLQRTIGEFDPRSFLIIMSCGLMDIEKEKDGLRVICTIIAGIGCVYGSLKNYMCFQLNNNID
jgi:hypothetical protein